MVPLPVMLQLYESIPEAGPLYVFVEFGHTLLLPVMEQVGDGLTVIRIVSGVPGQLSTGFPPVYVGVTMMVAVTEVLPLLTAVNEAIFPVPLAARPILVVLFVQLYVVTLVPVKLIGAVLPPLQTI